MNTNKIDLIKAEVERLKEETSIGLSEHENGVEQGRMEILNAISKLFDSLQKVPMSSIWHNASEKSNKPESVVIINPNDYSGDVIPNCIGVNEGNLWAYTSNLLNIENPCNFGKNLQEEPVSIWHDSSEMPKEKKVCLIRYSANDGVSTNNFEVVIAEPLTRRFVTRSYPHKTGYQHTILGETTIKVDEYQDRREKIPFSDIDEWAYIDDLININL